MYIFDENGTFIYNDTNSILDSGETAQYYTLVPIKKQSNYYHYIIGYVHNNLLYFLNYKFYFSENSNILMNSIKGKMHDYYDSNLIYIDPFYIINKGLSCQYMIFTNKYYEYEDILVCFFITYDSFYYLTVDYFLPNESGIIRKSSFYPDYYDFDESFGIKSVLTQNKSKALIAISDSRRMLHYVIFNINNVREITIGKFEDDYCRNQYHGLKVNYYKDKKDYILSCIDDNGKILIEFFDKNLNDYNYTNKYSDCENINGYSILFIYYDQVYYILSDVKCNGIENPFNLLHGDIIENENNEEEEEEEEVVKEAEEEKEEEEEDEEEKEEEEKNEEEKEKEEIDDDIIIEKECEKLEKCKYCNKDSIGQNLCIKECNNKKGYYFINSLSSENDVYIDCANSTTKPSNFYFNREKKEKEEIDDDIIIEKNVKNLKSVNIVIKIV